MMVSGFIKIPRTYLNLEKTLITGQNFRWRKRFNEEHSKESWIGIIENRFVVSLIQTDNGIDYVLLNDDIGYLKQKYPNLEGQIEDSLKNYFRLDIESEPLYKQWSKSDKNFKKISTEFRGIRLLRQEVIENIFSFICSANNNIVRITKMVETLAEKYGQKLATIDEKPLYSFPTIKSLSKVAEEDLRTYGFGYRAKLIVGAAQQIQKESDDEGGVEVWTDRLKSMNYDQSRRKLMTIPGIGPKVADCICLMSLGHTEAVPIDTHVQQITANFYKTRKELETLKFDKKNSLSKKNYDMIGNFYRNLFGSYAGWAQTVLFCSNLLKKK